MAKTQDVDHYIELSHFDASLNWKIDFLHRRLEHVVTLDNSEGQKNLSALGTAFFVPQGIPFRLKNLVIFTVGQNVF